MECIGKLLSHNNFNYEHCIYDIPTIFITTLANVESFYSPFNSYFCQGQDHY